ncbi:Fic family protein [Neolewinella sp.]|uniref:Fic family protein n=1 Tax=Neolewinella sp. TaxID=2993543 RepID=UPI003B520E47
MNSFEPGHLVSQKDFKSFIPSELNRKWRFTDPALLYQLSKADRALGQLDTFSELVDLDLYVTMHKTKEATLSSRIEGTRTHFEEVFLDVSAVSRERRDDWEEVKNYLTALEAALALSQRLPFSSRFIRAVHKPLMQGVRGERKLPGEFRSTQNWIGGSMPSNASFVPPPAHELPRLMGDLEKFANDDRDLIPGLVKTALLHYQFETIHPFLDGNGRVGRLLITTFLVERGLLRTPILYLSAYLERNRQQYYHHLSEVRTTGNLTAWLQFFLRGVEETANDGVATFREILKLERSMTERLRPLGARAARAHLAIRYLFRNPVITPLDLQPALDTTPATIYRLVTQLAELGILTPVATPTRQQYYAFNEYIHLFR